MIQFPNFDPVAVSIGPVKIHWYGIMYLVGFVGGFLLARLRIRRLGLDWTGEQLSDLLFYTALGVVLGGRLGYVLFYNLPVFLGDPLMVFRVWEGGMSFHGGLLGVLVAMWLYARHSGRGFFELTDFIAPVVPVGLGAGRLGNFINGELWGKVTDVPWAVVYDGLPRHPSQLYELLLEGVVMFVVLWFYAAKPRPRCAVSGLFALLYGVFRCAVEFVRVPDAHIGYLAFGWLTMGQLLSLPLVVLGIVLLVHAYRQPAPVTAGKR
ncbi:MAG TPA: prolipoprotein diacylglyceryl transferase [Gammaproteobacteria bacterium]|nr:prolipoprotein diacylglyceryl transferase [Gammaproteobacteria bacterium]